MSNEEYWLYGPGYATLGRQAIAIAQFYLPVLQEYCALADQKEEQEKVVRRFVARVLRDIDARRIANQAVRDGYGGLWPHALQLLSDVAPQGDRGSERAMWSEAKSSPGSGFGGAADSLLPGRRLQVTIPGNAESSAGVG